MRKEATLTLSLNDHVTILVLYNSGLTDRQIAERSGHPEEEIIEWRCEYGYRKNRSHTEAFALSTPHTAQREEKAHDPPKAIRPKLSSRRKERRGRYQY